MKSESSSHQLSSLKRLVSENEQLKNSDKDSSDIFMNEWEVTSILNISSFSSEEISFIISCSLSFKSIFEVHFKASVADSSKNNKSNHLKITDYLEMICWCIENQTLLKKNNYSKHQFFQALTFFMKKMFNKNLRTSDRTIAHLIKAHKITQKKTKKKSEIAIFNINLNQILDLWIEILDDLKALKIERQKSEVAKQAEMKKLVRIQQADLMKQAVKWRRQNLEASESKIKVNSVDSLFEREISEISLCL